VSLPELEKSSEQIAGYLILKAAWWHLYNKHFDDDEPMDSIELVASVRMAITEEMSGTTLVRAHQLAGLVIDPRFK
jgi:hypothetical protein